MKQILGHLNYTSGPMSPNRFEELSTPDKVAVYSLAEAVNGACDTAGLLCFTGVTEGKSERGDTDASGLSATGGRSEAKGL